jgi:small toxic polypeptide LdrA/B/C/D
MAFTYLTLNILFMVVAILLIGIPKYSSRRLFAGVIIILFILTLIFDSMLVSFHIISYTQFKIVGLHLGTAPIEDFFYPLLAAIIIPKIWQRIGHKK